VHSGRSWRRGVGSERGGVCLARRAHRAPGPPLGGPRLGLGLGDVALVAISNGEHDAHAGTEEVEDILNRPRGAARGQPEQAESHVLTLIADVDAGVPTPLGLLLANSGVARRDRKSVV